MYLCIFIIATEPLQNTKLLLATSHQLK